MSSIVLPFFFCGHFATNDASYATSQVVGGVVAGQTYSFSGWVNIPRTEDKFTFKIQLDWRDSANHTLGSDTVKTYSALTSGWSQATATVVAPPGASSCEVRMDITSLRAPIYVDDFALQ